jgi:uncharacterized protein YdeI (YjbR/CyaY-like superfamily)
VTKPPPDHFHAADRAAWTAWLEQHHATAPHVFLVFYKTATRVPCILYAEAVEEALCFGWIDGVIHKLDDQRFTYRFTPRRPGSAWSVANKARIARLDEAGVLRAAGRAAIAIARETGAWDKPARAVMPDEIPPELAAGLARNSRAAAAYAEQSPGKQRDWQRWVHQAVRAETRARRAARAIACLAGGDPHPWLLGRVVEKHRAAAKAATKQRR